MTKRIRISITVLFTVVAFFAATGVLFAGQPSGAAEPPTIRVAHLFTGGVGGDFAVYLEEGLKAFAAENADIANFVFEVEQGDNLRNKIKLDLAADNLPDVFYYWSLASMLPMIDAGLLANVKEYFDESDQVDFSDYQASALAAYKYGDAYYAIPDNGFKDYFLANSELFDRFGLDYPETYQDLLDVGEVFRANGIIPLAVGSKGGNPSHFMFGEMYYQFGSLDYMEGIATGDTSFNTPLIVRTAERVLELARAGIFPKDTIGNGDFQPAVALYNDEQAAMILGQTWEVSWYRPEIVEKSHFMFFPKIEGAVNDPSTFTVGNVNNAWVITSEAWNDPAKRPGVIAVMDFLTSDQTLEARVNAGAFVYKNGVNPDPEKVPVLMTRVMEFTAPQQPLTNFWSLMPDPVSQEVISSTLDELWAQAITAQGFVDKVNASIVKALGN